MAGDLGRRPVLNRLQIFQILKSKQEQPILIGYSYLSTYSL